MGRIDKLIMGAFVLMMAVIFALVMSAGKNLIALLAGLSGLVLLAALAFRAGEISAKARRRVWIGAWSALFALQCALAYRAYFLPGFDAYSLIKNAFVIFSGEGTVNHAYFSHYPNNILLVQIYVSIFRALGRFVSETSRETCLLMLVFTQCALNTGAGILTQRLAYRMTGSSRFAAFASCVYMAFIGLSPWILVPYSEGFGLIFPVAIFNLYASPLRERHPLPCWGAIGALALAGYLIKPQLAVAFIAVCLIEAVDRMKRRQWKGLFALCALFAAVFGLTGPALDGISANLGLELQEDYRNGYSMNPLHFVMMGLNEETVGIYSGEDVYLSFGYDDPAQRRAAQLAVIGERLNGMGPRGLLAHLARKTRVNYGDGTFAWGGEGYFFYEMSEDKDSVLSPLLKDLIGYGEAKRYGATKAYFQGIWLALMLCALASAFACREAARSGQRSLYVSMALALIGLTLFVTIFEARARYLYAYAPVYLLIALGGLWAVMGEARFSAMAKKGPAAEKMRS